MGVDKKPNLPSHLKDLILLFSIPIGIAAIIAALVYIPRFFANPKYDFIYSLCPDYSCKDHYYVNDLGYVNKDRSDTNEYNYYDRSASLRYYDAESDSTREITLEEASHYRLNTSSKSPDGYTLSSDTSDSGFLFWGNYDEGWYLKSGSKKKEVELATGRIYYSDSIRFLGWVGGED